LHWIDEKKHQKILHEKRDMPAKGKGWGKMNPVYLFEPFSRIPEEILKY